MLHLRYDGKAADVFSCACVLFFMATGKTPFNRDDFDQGCQQHMARV
jgi:serine/threonine protein kinase